MGEGLNRLFIKEIEDMYSSEKQIVQSLPKLIGLASSKDLKDALRNHLKETKEQVKRIEKIFSILGEKIEKNTCEAMKGLLQETNEMVAHKKKSPLLDAAIISAAQKIEHYEIASYGTLRSFAKNLSFEREIINLIQETLDEEGAADKKLTRIAEGSIFHAGINREAARLTKDK